MLKENLTKVAYIIDDKSKKKIWFILLLSLFGTLLELIGVGIVIPIVNIILDKDLFLENIEKIKFLHFLNLNSGNILSFSLYALIILFVIKNSFLIIFAHIKSKYITDVQIKLSKNLLGSYYKLDYLNLISKDSSVIIRNCLKEVGVFSKTFLEFMNLFIETSIVVSILVLMQTQIPILSIIIFVIMTLLISIYYYAIKDYLFKLGENRLNFLTTTIKKLNQFVFSLKEIKIFNKSDKLFSDFNISNSEAQNYSRIKGFISEITKYVLEVIVIVLIIAIIYIYTLDQKNSQDIIVALSLLVASAFKIFPSMNKINSALQSIKYNSPSTDALFKEISYFKNSKKIHKENFPFDRIFELEAKNLSFSYDKKNLFKNINFKLISGQTIGIIGETGSGKTTLSNILSGLIKPVEGVISINHSEIDLTQYEMNNVIGYVPQTPYLVDDTILNNIAFGEFEKNIDIKRVNSVIKKARLEELINNSNKGIYSMVGESGLKMSGGQRQRICIARALYKKPKILIFDEPTSALDNDTSEEIMKNITSNKDVIKIIVTHKEKDKHYFDQIIKM
jgi:ATP-binding cassette, subfamily B, bacterial PglK